MAKPHYRPITVPDGYHKGITGWIVTYVVHYRRKGRWVSTTLRGRGYTPQHAMYNLSRRYGYTRAVNHDCANRIPGVPMRWRPMTPDEVEHQRRHR